MDPDSTFQVIQDPDSDMDTDPDTIRIQGFADQKLKKFFDKKLQFTYALTTGKDFSPQKRKFSTSKKEIY